MDMSTMDVAAKTETLVDSLRDLSPTRARNSSSDESDGERSSWMSRHPSALDMFEKIMSDDAEGKEIVMFLDYDGTLSLITEDHDKAYMTEEMREVVKDVSMYFKTAIISGRSTDKVQGFVNLNGIHYAGSHGMDIKGPVNADKSNQEVMFQPAKDYVPMINEVVKILQEKTQSITGATVEHNKFCLTVHFRRVDEKEWGTLAELVKSVLTDYPKLRLTEGRKVLELRPSIKWDKGKALEFLLNSLGIAESKDVLPIYIGDDRTDEDAFKVLCERGQGFGIVVSKISKKTNASYSLQDPSQVKEFLKRLVQWRKQTLGEKKKK